MQGVTKNKEKLSIGIDAKWYFEGPASGKMVVRNLVNELAQLKLDSFEFYFILDKRHQKDSLQFENETTKKIFLWSRNNLISNVFILPFCACRHNLDVVLYQTSISFFGKHKKIAYIHDLIFITHPQYYTLLERAYLKPLKFLTKFADFVMTVSNFEKKRIEILNFTKKDIEVLHHGVDPIFQPLERFDVESIQRVKKQFDLPEKYILYVGRINKRKNVPTLIEAFALIEDTKVKLVLVGNKEWKTDDINTQIKKLNLLNRVILTGPLYGEELALVYASAFLFCFPSFEESFGLPPLEAMASGLPVIVSKTSSIPEVCGQAGIYVNASDPIEIKNAIEDILTNVDKRESYIRSSLERAKNFSWEGSAKDLIKILKNRYDFK